MSKAVKSTHPVTRAVLGVTALGVIAISANLLISSLGVGFHKVDFTENHSLTLSDGTKSILKDLKAPVTIRYYASRSSNYMPQELKLHMKRVDDVLKSYESLSNGYVRVENLDPQPDTDAEDAANIDGINGQQYDGDNLYFGVAISCLDRTKTIPFLNPQEETMLEYNLSRAISDVSRPSKAVIGLMSALPIAGSPGNPMMGQQGAQPWIFYSQLSQSYEVKDVTMHPDKIDPSIAVLLVMHPADITPEAEFAIDQYVLQGGTVIACLDPFSYVASQSGGGRGQMGGGVSPSSTLPHLLPAWGLQMDAKVAADRTLATQLNQEINSIAALSLTKDCFPQKDDAATKDLNSAVMFFPGGLTKTGGAGLTTTTLARTTTDAGFVDGARAARFDPNLAASMAKAGHALDLAVHVEGEFKTAFPDGKPANKEEAPKEGEKKEDALKTATKKGHVFVISDVDAFFDNFAYRVVNFGGSPVASPSNGNSSLLMNLIDQAASSPYLIGSHSRAAVARPFTRIRELEKQAEAAVGVEVKKLQDKMEVAQNKVNELQAQKSAEKQLYLSDAQEEEGRKFAQEQVDARKQIRELEKDLRRQKDQLTNRVTLLCVGGVPLLVLLFASIFFLSRRLSVGAR